MTQPEFLAWQEFYKLHPFDDHARFHRPAALIATSMTGTPVDELLDWLEGTKPGASKYSAADLATMRSLGLKPPRAS